MYRFSQHQHNRFQLLVDGDNFIPSMLHAIDAAQTFILFELYLFESSLLADRFIDALANAAKRGVRVHLLLDDFGCRDLSAIDRKKLIEQGIVLKFYNPLHIKKTRDNLVRNHRKLLMIDGVVAFVGGVGISDAFVTNHGVRGWHEMLVVINGEVLADWFSLFNKTWLKVGGQPLENNPTFEPQGHSLGRVVSGAGFQRQEIKTSLIRHIRAARIRVWITTAYFVPTWRVRRTIRAAAKRGVDVRIVLPGPISDHPWISFVGRRFYRRLLRSGVRIFEHSERFSHAKAVLCDDWVTIGSCNLDHWNLRWNLEANQEVCDREFASVLVKVFEQDFDECREIDAESWGRRPGWTRFRERLSGLLHKLLTRI